MLESSSGRQTQTARNSLAVEDQILDFKPRSSHPGPIVINRKKTLQNLMKENPKEIRSIIFMDFTEISDLTLQDLKAFFDWIGRLDNLGELNMNLSQDNNHFWNVRDPLKSLKSYLKRINPITSLTSLKMNLSKRKDIPIDFFQEFGIKFPRLSKLDINLRSCDRLKGDLIRGLANIIHWLSCLRELSLDFAKTQLGNKATLALISNLKSLRFLRYLKLDFSGSQKLNEIGIEGLCKALNCLYNLQDLSLNICACQKIKNPDVRKLVFSIKNVRTLSSLFLSVANINPLHVETVQILMGHGGDFNQLTRLSLGLPLKYECLGEPKGFVPLLNLSDLELSVYDCTIEGKYPSKDIWEGLASLPRLSRLCLHFGLNSLFMDQILKNLSRIFRRMRLKDLELNFYGNSNVKISTWEILYDGIDTLADLKRLSLNFPDRHFVDSKVVHKLGSSLKNTKGLVNFTLGMRVFSGLTRKSLQSINLLLRNQKNLNTLKFNFLWNYQLKPKSFSEIFSALSEAKSLTKINLCLEYRLFPFHKNQAGPISYLRAISALRYLELEGSRCEESNLLALSVQLSQLSQVISIILRFHIGTSISPQTKLKFCQNIRKHRGLKEFHLSIKDNWLPVVVDNFQRISWGMKDIYAGYNNDEIHYYQSELKRINKRNRRESWISFFIVFFIALIFMGGLAVLLVFASKEDRKAEQREAG